MQILYFTRDKGEYRQVTIHKEGTYRIWAQTGNVGKIHQNFNAYYQRLVANGWRKTTLANYLSAKWRAS